MICKWDVNHSYRFDISAAWIRIIYSLYFSCVATCNPLISPRFTFQSLYWHHLGLENILLSHVYESSYSLVQIIQSAAYFPIAHTNRHHLLSLTNWLKRTRSLHAISDFLPIQKPQEPSDRVRGFILPIFMDLVSLAFFNL